MVDNSLSFLDTTADPENMLVKGGTHWTPVLRKDLPSYLKEVQQGTMTPIRTRTHSISKDYRSHPVTRVFVEKQSSMELTSCGDFLETMTRNDRWRR